MRKVATGVFTTLISLTAFVVPALAQSQPQSIDDLLARDVPLPKARPFTAPAAPSPTLSTNDAVGVGAPIVLQPNLANGASPAPTPPSAPASASASTLPAAPQPVAQPKAQTRSASAPPTTGRAKTSGQSFNEFKAGLAALKRGDAASADKHRAQTGDALSDKTLEWLLARNAGAYMGAARMQAFLRANPGWPGRDRIRRNIERVYFDRASDHGRVVAFFRAEPPLSGYGEVAYARALFGSGQRGEGGKWLRKAWYSAGFDAAQESKILAEFGGQLSRSDHFSRANGMLYRERVSAAQRMARYVGSSEKAVISARAAVVRRKGNAGSLLSSVPRGLRRDPGYMHSQIQHLRRAENVVEAAKLMNQVPRKPDQLIDTGEWWVERRVLLRMLLDRGQTRLAYQMAAEHSSTEPADIIAAEWHAGWVALSYTNNPRRAAKHFEAMRRYAETPISVSRAEYWAGRAYKASGNRGKANRHFKAAAQHEVAYYGQLAAAELGQRRLKIRSTGKSRRAESFEPVRAADLLAAAGRNDLALNILVGTSFYAPDAGTIVTLAEKARKLGSQHIAVNIAKRGIRNGFDVANEAYPVGAMPNKGRNNAGVEPPLVYAIARQESEFRTGAVSGAGARGLMQLLPGTAKSIARETGLAYSRGRLTSDPAYNMALGSAYLGKRVNNFSGSYIMAAAAYNAGKGRVDEWITRFGDPRRRNVDPIEWVERIPFSETRNYVMRVLENTQVYRARLNGGSARLQIKQDLARGR